MKKELILKAKLLSYECELQGMIALNKEREHQQYALAYSDNAFCELSNKVDEALREYLESEANK